MYNAICNLGESMEIILNKAKDLGIKQVFEFVYELPTELTSFTTHQITDNAKVTGTYLLNNDDSVDVKANIIVPMKWFCDRCGDPFEKNLFFEMEETFSPTQTEDSYFYAGNKIVLDKAVEEQFVLNIQGQALCKTNCKGVCSVCGTNLNYGSCTCKKQTDTNNPFAQIKDKLN